MSYSFDGKVSGQQSRCNFSKTVKCEQCCKLIPAPLTKYVKFSGVSGRPSGHICYYYLYTPYYIYETKSTFAVVYCSDKCRRKHNHRFNRRVIDNTDKLAMTMQRFWDSLEIGDKVTDTIYNKNAEIISLTKYSAVVSVDEDKMDTDDGYRYMWELYFPNRSKK